MRPLIYLLPLTLVLAGCPAPEEPGSIGSDPNTGPIGDGGRVVILPNPNGGGGGKDGGSGGDPMADGGTVDGGLTASERLLLGLAADTWFSVPASKMRPACAPGSFGVSGFTGCAAIVSAWGGGAWDSDHRQMLIWGGGHQDYSGNEVYAFDVRTFTWKRLNDPSPPPFDIDPLHDGKPVSRHTYDGLQFVPGLGMLAIGGSTATTGNATNVTWKFDPATLGWTHLDPTQVLPAAFDFATGYDAPSKTLLTRAAEALWAYDLTANSWRLVGNFGTSPLWPRYAVHGSKRGVIDTKRRLFWTLGSNDYLVWDIAQRLPVTEQWLTSGAGDYSNAGQVTNYPDQLFLSGGAEIHDALAPGVDYDAKADQLVAWKGGAPWVLNLSTKKWIQRNGTGAPAQQQANGTFGRFRYLPRYNVFILVNSVDEDVLFYKNTAGGP